MYVFNHYNPFQSVILWYGRYIDDLLFIIDINVTADPSFATFLNFDPLGLRFSVAFELQSIPFLDLLLQVREGTVHTTYYCK